MSQGVNVASIYVRDQEEALQFYVGKLGFKVHTDVKNGDYRWLTVQHPDQPSFQLGLSKAMAPMQDPAAVQAINELVAKGALPLHRCCQRLAPSVGFADWLPQRGSN